MDALAVILAIILYPIIIGVVSKKTNKAATGFFHGINERLYEIERNKIALKYDPTGWPSAHVYKAIHGEEALEKYMKELEPIKKKYGIKY